MKRFDDKMRLAAGLLRSAEALLITAGAGMGVDSGLPDFRGNSGFLKAYPAQGRIGSGVYVRWLRKQSFDSVCR